MSDSVALVRFDDGELRVAWFAADPRFVVPLLFGLGDGSRLVAASADEVASLADRASNSAEPTDAEAVVVWVEGIGSWPGSASRTAGMLVRGMGPLDDFDGEIQPGRPAWAEAWEAGLEGGRRRGALRHPAAEAAGLPTPAPAFSVPPVLDDDRSFAAAATRLMGGAVDGLLLERFAEAALARAGDEPGELAMRHEPLVGLARSRARSYDHMVGFVAAAILELVAAPHNDDHIEFGIPISKDADPYFLVPPLWSEVIGRLRARTPGPLLSMPTHPSGAVDPVVLEERLSAVGDRTLLAWDLAIAELRSGARAGTLAPDRDWSQPDSYSVPAGEWSASYAMVLSRREYGIAQSCRSTSAVLPSLFPFSPADAVLAMLPERLVVDVERTPSWSSPAYLGSLCAWLATEGVAPVAAGAAACALGLGAKAPENRVPAIGLLIVHAEDPRWALGHVPVALSAAITAGAVKVRRVRDALVEAASIEPAVVRDTTLGVIPELVRTGHRDAPLLMAVAADAIARAGSVTASPPSAVLELASLPGKSKLLTEARRLIAAIEGAG